MPRANDEASSNRLAAQTFMPMMVNAFQDSLREVASLSRWLLATLVLVNGAAVISVLPLKISSEVKFVGALVFLVGVLAALVAAICSLYAFKRVSDAAGKMVGYWLSVADDGQRAEALEASMKRHLDQAIGSGATRTFVFASMAAFLIGCAMVGWGMLT